MLTSLLRIKETVNQRKQGGRDTSKKETVNAKEARRTGVTLLNLLNNSSTLFAMQFPCLMQPLFCVRRNVTISAARTTVTISVVNCILPREEL